MSLRFGTDGVRGAAFTELTTELSFALGRAAASVFSADRVAVGRDTRESGPALQQALTAGLVAGGASVIDLGVLPTPGIAYVSAMLDIPAAVVSASHNPFHDNGIKFFAPGGRKLTVDEERAIESSLHEFMGVIEEAPTEDGSALVEQYLGHLDDALAGRSFDDVNVVLDCANGAASAFAAHVFEGLGAKVTVLNDEPNGRNINDGCGSTHPEELQRVVVEHGADVGLAFDGDADRVLAVDETGRLIDGDQIMGMLAIDGKANGWLKDNTLVLTVMSNLGLRQSMERHGVNIHETPVGDKYVLEALNANGWSLGGEQSGHIVLPAVATTGDGMLTGLALLDLVQRSGKRLSELADEAMIRLPQVLRNVRVQRMADLKGDEVIATAVRQAQHVLGGAGRILLRPSGTEPLVRVMVEAPSEEQAVSIAEELIGVVGDRLGKV